MDIPNLLQKNAERIRALDVGDQAIPFNRDAWRVQISDIDDILDGFNSDALSRHTICSIFPGDPMRLDPCTPERQRELRRFFVVVMIWGYGKVGVGPWRVAQMMKSPSFPQILCEVGKDCYYGLFLRAYERLIGNINRLGPSFASKYLYFFCRNYGATVKPLIFDSVVIQTMRTFDWPTEFVDYIAIDANPKSKPFAYGQYLVLMHNWANAIQCRPDQLEYFLWARGMGILRVGQSNHKA